MGGVVHQPGDEAAADHQHHGDEDADLDERHQQMKADPAERHGVVRRHDGGCRQQYQRENHHEIFDHQPADRDAAASGFEDVPVLQGTDHDDGAGDRQRKAENEARLPRPAQGAGQPRTHQGDDDDLADRTRHGDARHGNQVL